MAESAQKYAGYKETKKEEKVTFNNQDIRKILSKYLNDVERLHKSEDYHDLEEFSFRYAGFEKDKTFVTLMEFLLRYFTLRDYGV